jgi:preprotein translocase subunit SecA
LYRRPNFIGTPIIEKSEIISELFKDHEKKKLNLHISELEAKIIGQTGRIHNNRFNKYGVY